MKQKQRTVVKTLTEMTTLGETDLVQVVGSGTTTKPTKLCSTGFDWATGPKLDDQ